MAEKPDIFKNVQAVETFTDEEMSEMMEIYDVIWEEFKKRGTRMDLAFTVVAGMADAIVALSVTPDIMEKVAKQQQLKSKEES